VIDTFICLIFETSKLTVLVPFTIPVAPEEVAPKIDTVLVTLLVGFSPSQTDTVATLVTGAELLKVKQIFPSKV
jgi:hypothetical protein